MTDLCLAVVCSSLLVLVFGSRTVAGQQESSGSDTYLPPSARYSYSKEQQSPQQYQLSYQEQDKLLASYGQSDRRNFDRDGLLVSNSLLAQPSHQHQSHHYNSYQPHPNQMPHQLEESGLSAFPFPTIRNAYPGPMMSQYSYPYPYMQHSEPSPFVPSPSAGGMMLMSPNGEPISPYQGPMPYHHPQMPYGAMGHPHHPLSGVPPFMSPQSFGMWNQAYLPRMGHHGSYGYFGSPKIEIGQKLSNSIYANSDSLRYDLSSLKEGYNRQGIGSGGSTSSSGSTGSSASPYSLGYSAAVNSQQYSPSSLSSSPVAVSSSSPSSYFQSSLSSAPSSSSPSSYFQSSLSSAPSSSSPSSYFQSSLSSAPSSSSSSSYLQSSLPSLSNALSSSPSYLSTSTYPAALPNSYQTSDYAQATNGYRQYLNQQQQALLQSTPQQLYNRISQPYLPYINSNAPNGGGAATSGNIGSTGRSQSDQYSKSDYLKSSNSPIPSQSSMSSSQSSSVSSGPEITNNNNHKNSNSNKEELGFFRRNDNSNQNNSN